MAREVTLYRLIGLSLIGAVISLAPAGHASPPDQSWIPGLYDNSDFDDVILWITSNVGATHPSMVWSVRPVASAVGLVTPMAAEPLPRFPLLAVLSRDR